MSAPITTTASISGTLLHYDAVGKRYVSLGAVTSCALAVLPSDLLPHPHHHHHHEHSQRFAASSADLSRWSNHPMAIDFDVVLSSPSQKAAASVSATTMAASTAQATTKAIMPSRRIRWVAEFHSPYGDATETPAPWFADGYLCFLVEPARLRAAVSGGSAFIDASHTVGVTSTPSKDRAPELLLFAGDHTDDEARLYAWMHACLAVHRHQQRAPFGDEPFVATENHAATLLLAHLPTAVAVADAHAEERRVLRWKCWCGTLRSLVGASTASQSPLSIVRDELRAPMAAPLHSGMCAPSDGKAFIIPTVDGSGSIAPTDVAALEDAVRRRLTHAADAMCRSWGAATKHRTAKAGSPPPPTAPPSMTAIAAQQRSIVDKFCAAAASAVSDEGPNATATNGGGSVRRDDAVAKAGAFTPSPPMVFVVLSAPVVDNNSDDDQTLWLVWADICSEREATSSAVSTTTAVFAIDEEEIIAESNVVVKSRGMHAIGAGSPNSDPLNDGARLLADNHDDDDDAEVVDYAHTIEPGDDHIHVVAHLPEPGLRRPRRRLRKRNDNEGYLFAESNQFRNSIDPAIRVKTFVFEFFTQWLFPFSLPIVYLTQGKLACLNKGFLPQPNDLRGFIGQVIFTSFGYVPQLVVLGTFSTWAFLPSGLSVFFVLFRVLVISGKYASFGPHEYRRVMTDPNYQVFDKLLVASWLTIRRETIDEELGEAQLLARRDLKDYTLTLESGECVSARHYVRKLLYRAWCTPPPPTVGRILNVLAIGQSAHMLYEYFHRFGTDPANFTAAAIAIIVLNFFQCMLFIPVVYSFMWIGALHYKRLLLSYRAMFDVVVHSMWRHRPRTWHTPVASDDDDDADNSHSEGHLPKKTDVARGAASDSAERRESAAGDRSAGHEPIVDDGVKATASQENAPPKFIIGWQYLREAVTSRGCDPAMMSWRHPENLDAWIAIHRVLQNFGLTFSKRISFNFFATASVIAAMGLLFLEQTLMKNPNIPMIIVCTVVFAVCSLFGLITLFYASRINHLERRTLALVGDEELSLLLVPEEDRTAREVYVLELLGGLREWMEKHKDVEPIRVMYLPAETELISAFLAFIVSSAILVAQLFAAP